ncbi:hemoglobin [Haloferula luteola]|uniref:Hemoglobin n=1 Tax=Haloferula luteola TaxID=595692 RepID=A0A840V1U9_9BACT|nr:group 1 truncated hemoglobin [Haloferula luteola]MBB5351965.1 hemoglobin [Haloferula luteola]
MTEKPDHLFQAIGGEKGIELLVDRFYARVLADPKLAPFFAHAPMERLRMMQKEFFSEALGGPLFYSGHSLRQVHAGKGIRKEHLRKFVKHLLATLEDAEQDLGLTRRDVHAIYSRIAIEADRITDDVAESG